MKVCTTCKDAVFDDMPVCYGCMQSFAEYCEPVTCQLNSDSCSFDDSMVEEPQE